MTKETKKSRFVAYVDEGTFYDAPPITYEERKKAKEVWDMLTGKKQRD